MSEKPKNFSFGVWAVDPIDLLKFGEPEIRDVEQTDDEWYGITKYQRQDPNEVPCPCIRCYTQLVHFCVSKHLSNQTCSNLAKYVISRIPKEVFFHSPEEHSCLFCMNDNAEPSEFNGGQTIPHHSSEYCQMIHLSKGLSFPPTWNREHRVHCVIILQSMNVLCTISSIPFSFKFNIMVTSFIDLCHKIKLMVMPIIGNLYSYTAFIYHFEGGKMFMCLSANDINKN